MRAFVSIGLFIGCHLFLCQQRVLADIGDMACPAQDIHRGEKFTITKLPAYHKGSVLLVRGVDDVDYVISFSYDPERGSPSVPGSRLPPLAAKEFAKLTSITIDTSTAIGLPFSSRTKRPLGPARKIFTKAGLYTIALAVSIWAGEDGIYDNCAVKILTTAKDPEKLTCPKEVTLDAPFTIKDFPPRHQGYIFSITNTDTDTMHLISFDDRVQSLFPPPIPPQEFGKLTEITVDPKTVMGLPVDLDTHRPLGPAEKIFVNDGKYWIGVSPGFHPGIAPGKDCSVIFSNGHPSAAK